MKVRKTAWLAAPLLALTLTSCVGGANSGDESADPSSKAAGRAAVVEVTDTPGSLDKAVGAVKDADQSRCEAAQDGWVSEGEVTNTTDAVQNYRLYVSFMEKSETRGLIQVNLNEVAPGKSAPWKAEAKLSGKAVKCVLRVERVAAGS